jgi:hypothetical protein
MVVLQVVCLTEADELAGVAGAAAGRDDPPRRATRVTGAPGDRRCKQLPAWPCSLAGLARPGCGAGSRRRLVGGGCCSAEHGEELA